MPQKLDRCVSDVKSQGKSSDSAWGICVDSTGEKPHHHETKIREKVNGNRQVPYFNPPIKTNKIEPKVDKSRKNIGGTENFMTTDLWKKIFDSQLKRNRKEPRY